jgi:pteridine reductase
MRNAALQGKTALVTGSTKRIGREIALALGDTGVNIVAHHRNSANNAEELVEVLHERGVEAWSIQADFADLDETEQLLPRALAAAGPLDILVNNASVFQPSTIHDLDFTGLSLHMQVNSWAPLVLSRRFAQNSRAGKILNILDTRISGSDPAHLGYILSKQVLATLTEVMAREFAPGITVNGIAPGLILPPPGKDQHYLEARAKELPLKRHGGPGDIAEAALYLLSSAFVTGQLIFVDGGQHLIPH